MKSYLLYFFSGLFVFIFTGCDGQPYNKLVPFEKRELKSKAIKSNFQSKVDVLFIVDDSGSMMDHQINLIAGMNRFVDTFMKAGFINFHFGVTSSSPGNYYPFGGGKLRDDQGVAYVNRFTANAEKVIKDYLRLGTTGSGDEHFFDILTLALDEKLNPGNKGFLRDDSHFLVVFLTDSDDQSNLSAVETHRIVTKLLKGQKSRLNVAGAIIDKDGGDNCDNFGEPLPNKLKEFFKETNGTFFSLCRDDFGEPIAEIAKNLVDKASRFRLEQIPDLSTISLTYGTQDIPADARTGWSYNGETNEIVLGPDLDLKPEPKGTTVKFTFEPAYK